MISVGTRDINVSPVTTHVEHRFPEGMLIPIPLLAVMRSPHQVRGPLDQSPFPSVGLFL